MPKITYNPNNTEGKYPTAFEFRETELRKDDKIVATDLSDLYDVELTNLQDGDILSYEDSIQKWVNTSSGNGGGCNIITEDTEIMVGIGFDFESIQECFSWLNENCITIQSTLTISIMNDMDLVENVYLNHPYGENIHIEGNDVIIRGNSIFISNNNSIGEIRNLLFELPSKLYITDNSRSHLINIREYSDIGGPI